MYVKKSSIYFKLNSFLNSGVSHSIYPFSKQNSSVLEWVKTSKTAVNKCICIKYISLLAYLYTYRCFIILSPFIENLIKRLCLFSRIGHNLKVQIDCKEFISMYNFFLH